MKRAVTLCMLILLLSACAGEIKMRPPLEETGRTVAPPAGCEDLRARGGSC